ncbi:MAG: ATP-binding cassette domain-containing protein [Coriobacteriaceae bacterium]|nr:ATP-binding cassette domain-containing protein [Coriobacteriaceae bacterium]
MIEFQRVSKTYPDGTVAVEDFSLVAPSRQTTVLVGTSGSGKTTVLRMVNRMVEPTTGHVLWDGVDVATMNPVKLRRSIGYVLQEGGLFPHWTVLDNIATVPRLEGATRQDSARRASELLEMVGLDASMGSRYPAQLSGGQRQRVGVARALANDPLLLLMDEPFGALDPLVRRDLHVQVKRIREALGTTIIMVTHDMHEAMTLGHQVVVMQTGGRIVQTGAPEELLSSPATDFVADLINVSKL